MNAIFVNIFMALGGLGLFLFGMKMMSSGLETVAGDRLQGILQWATSNRFLAVIVGIVATIFINSSTATTIMTVSFVNSGMINLTQAIGIIMGANVGTTFSAQLIAFRIDTFAPLFIFIGVVMHFFFKSTKIRNIGYVILGFGILFFGITTMGIPLRQAAQLPEFREFLTHFDNPVLALMAGFIFTAVVQSSSASMGILVAMHLSGVPLAFQTSAFIILGTNIGTSTTTVIASIPASRDSKRAALFHIMYDVIGSTVFGTLIVLFPAILSWFETTWAEPARQVAMFHTLYNFATMFLLLPFTSHATALMQKIVPVTETSDTSVNEKKLMYLDAQNINKPTVAIYNAHLELCRMTKIASDNLEKALNSFFTNGKTKSVFENEKVINFLNNKITSKLVWINGLSLSRAEAEKTGKMFIILSDIERIGNHAVNIAEYAKTMKNNDLSFSKKAIEELKILSVLTKEITAKSLYVFEKQDHTQLDEVKELNKKIVKLSKTYLENHISRLKKEKCKPESGVIFSDIITDLERSAEHAKNIALSISIERKWNK